MRRLLLLTVLSASSLPLHAAEADRGPRDCDALMREIAAKIEARGVTSYSLQLVEADAPSSGRVVGRCAAGSRRIVYRRIELPMPTLAEAGGAEQRPRRTPR